MEEEKCEKITMLIQSLGLFGEYSQGACQQTLGAQTPENFGLLSWTSASDLSGAWTHLRPGSQHLG